MSLDIAVKQLLKEELLKDIDVAAKFAEQDARFENLQNLLQELSGKVELRGSEIGDLASTFERQKAEKEELDAKTSEDLRQAMKDVEDRVGRLQDDADGFGLAQLKAQVDELAKEIRDSQPRLDECSRISRESKGRVDDFGVQLNQLSRQFGEVHLSAQACEGRVAAAEGACADAARRVEAFEESLSKKYEKLWEDVLNAIQEVNDRQVEALKADLETKRQDARKETKSLIVYAQSMVSGVAADRRQLAVSKQLVVAWREQTWLSARRRLGIWVIGRLTLRKQRDAVACWSRRASLEKLVASLRKEYAAQIPDVARALEDSGLGARCDGLKNSLEKLEQLQAEKCSGQALTQGLEEQRGFVEQRFQAFEEAHAQLAGQLSGHAESIARAEDAGGALGDRLAGVDERLAEHERDAAALQEGLREFAKAAEVQSMLKDILLMWNSIKQLDVAKADRKDMSRFEVECSNMDKLSARRGEDLEALVAARVREETVKVQEKYCDLDGKLDEQAKQVRHWKQMWERLSGLVEDLVAKFSGPQGASAAPALAEAVTERSSRPPSLSAATTARRPSPARSRPDLLPSMSADNLDRTLETDGPHSGMSLHGESVGAAPTQHVRGHGGYPAAAEQGVESRAVWASAKAIVDSTMDAIGPPKPMVYNSRPRSVPRPKSASARRAHDRGRF